jgi:hypothetical protein
MGVKHRLCVTAICLAVLAAGSLAATAQEAFDVTRLPRVPGGKEIFINAVSTIYTTPTTVPATAEAVGKLLAAGGWQSYVAPFSAQSTDPSLQILSYKRGAQGLSVFITVAPAQANATSVSYTPVALANDLPFPKNANEIAYDPSKPYLSCVNPDDVDATLTFFSGALTGWKLWSSKDGATPAATAQKTEKGAYAYYVRDGRQPLLLVLARNDDGKTKIEMKAVPADSLVLESKRLAMAAENAARNAAAKDVGSNKDVPSNAPPVKSATDTMVEDMLKQALQVAREAATQAPLAAPPQPRSQATAQAASDAEPPLRAAADTPAPIPVPEGADDVDYDGEDGKLEFNSASSVKSVAAFYRNAMKPLGWKEQRSVINRPNMVVLNFSKSGKDLTVTVMQMGDKANVTANGEGLVTLAAKPGSPKADADAAQANVTEKDLEAEESANLPAPTRHTMMAGEQTPFRREMNASVPANVEAVLGFYRRELGKRNWKEQSDGAVVKPDEVALSFAAPEGPAVLKLGRKDGETTVNLKIRMTTDATKAGIVPKPGQGKILFGNPMPSEATVTINKQTVKIAAGAGANAPDGPTIDVAPGTYKFSFKVGGKNGKSDEVTIGAGETWGLLIGPVGALTLQVY